MLMCVFVYWTHVLGGLGNLTLAYSCECEILKRELVMDTS